MTIEFSKLLSVQARGNGSNFFTRSIDLAELNGHSSPLHVMDDFRVSGQPFGPHPHAGFSAVTYVFEDSEAKLRNRDSLGHDIIVGPGSMVWSQAGRGIIHEELAWAPGRELHGLQFFVNLSAKNKLTDPQVFVLHGDNVPQWQNAHGDRVRVVVGSFEGSSSPLVPTEPFTFLDVELRRAISFDLARDHNTLVYVLTGNVLVRADEHEQRVPAAHAVALHGGSAAVTFEASQASHCLVLSGLQIREPTFAYGPFIMNDKNQADEAMARYRSGAMGYLEPADLGAR